VAERRRVALDPAVASILRPSFPDEESVPAAPRARTPHERGRSARRLGVTFPTAAWADEVRALAQRWRVRPADVLVLAVSRLMADLEDGEVVVPLAIEFQTRAGAGFDLPWEPGE